MECQKRAFQLLDKFNIPRGLFPLDNIIEIGLVRSEGFIWIRQKKKKDHYFEQIGRSVSFAAEVTAFIEPRRMKKFTKAETGNDREIPVCVLNWIFPEFELSTNISDTPIQRRSSFAFTPVTFFIRRGSMNAVISAANETLLLICSK
ncbi:hypothetical protein EJ110_NYTH32652 [Nymphaea thermarum]|nr:hypothetical protein EJ110_NYTH32652 [Nymphaea thermarum]